MSTELDVVVVGAGGCGLAAAIAAHDAGVSTAILEKLDRPGGNSSLSTGSLPAAGSRFQREAGIVDSAERMEADLLAFRAVRMSRNWSGGSPKFRPKPSSG